MIKWYFIILDGIENLNSISSALILNSDPMQTRDLKSDLKRNHEQLLAIWQEKFPGENFGNVGRHISFGDKKDYQDIIQIDLPELIQRAKKHLLQYDSSVTQYKEIGFDQLLHQKIKQNCLALYLEGHYRESVLNSIMAVFDLIRERTKFDFDGDRLINEVLSEQHPILILDEIETESGRNDQKGFMQIFKGAFRGIRNPKAHSLEHDLNKNKAAQYLIFASLLARRVEEAKINNF